MTQYITVAPDDRVEAKNGVIKLHDAQAFEGMRRAGRLAAEILDSLVPHVVPGVTTAEIDSIVQRMTLDAGAVPATLGYRGFTKSCCTSINHVVCHGIPGDKALREGDIAHAIQSHAEKHRYSVVRDFCGHGLGRLFHDSPEVIHAGRPGTGPELKPGMFFTIEPMINIGRADVKLLEDGWAAVTRDRSLSAQFEHSVGITETGCEIFTKSPKGLDRPPYS